MYLRFSDIVGETKSLKLIILFWIWKSSKTHKIYKYKMKDWTNIFNYLFPFVFNFAYYDNNKISHLRTQICKLSANVIWLILPLYLLNIFKYSISNSSGHKTFKAIKMKWTRWLYFLYIFFQEVQPLIHINDHN